MRLAPQKILLPTELKKRNSVGPPPAALRERIGRTTKVRKRIRLVRKNQQA
jgi:hypothetical protein